jgi:hypothetical protein
MALILDGTTGVPVTTVTGTLPVANGGSGVTTSTGTGANVLGTSPTLTTPTISSLTSASATALTLQSAGTTGLTIDTSQNLAFNSGYGSVATAYGCRAWVNFNGTGVVAIRASGNVSSITDNGTGNYTVNFSTAMVDANYCPTGTAEDVASGSFVTGNSATVPTTSGFTFYVVSSAGALTDAVRVNVGIFR